MDTLRVLVTTAQAGDLDAFGQLVERFQRMAHAVAYTMLGDAYLAEDVAQEAFIEAFICLPKLREPDAFPGWFRRIVHKRGDRLVRGKGPALISLESAEQAIADTNDPAAAVETRELQRRVRAAIDILPEPDRLPVTLFYLAGYAQQEIATIMELPLTTIKKRLFHARQRLRVLMDELVREQFQEPPAHDTQFARAIQFFIAVRIGDVVNVRASLDHDPALLDMHERWDENTALRYGLPIVSSFTALHRAVYNDDAALVTFLLERHADVDARTGAGQTPLHLAVQLDHPVIVALLLAGAADPNAATDLALTPLHYAVILDRLALAQALLAAGADVALPDACGQTPLDWARLKGFDQLVLLLSRHSTATS